jgi:hypothetical protein
MNQPTYKSIKVTFETWQALTSLSSKTGEPRTRLLERLIREALDAREAARSGKENDHDVS